MRTNRTLPGILILTSFAMLALAQCRRPAKSGMDQIEKEKALSLLQNNCFSCHVPEMNGERAAPPMFKVQQHYQGENVNETEFIDALVAFVLNPTEEHSKMPGAVRNFGLMPKMNYKEEDLRLIGKYLYKVDVSTEDWDKEWAEFKLKSPSAAEDDVSYEDKALGIANRAKAVLGKNLLGAINKGGSAYAVSFCNERAIPLIDSMAKIYDAKIRRVSDQTRNPNNQANESELEYIAQAKAALLKSEKPKPMFIETSEQIRAYITIETNQMCLQCHGKSEKIEPQTLQKIKEYYPNDQATGYDINQIRGIFVVEMKK